MKALHTRIVPQPTVLSRKLIKLERSGRYEDALQLLSESWPAPENGSVAASLPPLQAAHLQLRYGAVIGFNGHSRGISGSQAQSKDLLTNALEIFSTLRDEERVAECENYISLAYWRTGEHREAETWVDNALARELKPDSGVRLYSHVVKSLVLMDTGRHVDNVAYCRSVEETFRLHGDPFLNGCIFANLGISLKDLGHASEALASLDLAKSFQERTRHRPYLGTINNNLALLYKNVGRFHMAHFSVDKAIAIYRRIGDRSREGSSLETKAQIFLAQGNCGLAHATIDRSITILRKSENLAYLAESILLKSKIYLDQSNFADAILNLIEAVEITRNQSGEAAARAMIADFQRVLETEPKRPASLSDEAAPTELELVLPAEIAGHKDYKAVWIHNSQLSVLRVLQGSLVLVADEPVKRGDAAALLHTASGEVSCGFYDADFGIVALNGPNGVEPQLFAQEEVKVLGKIVAVCEEAAGPNAKRTVRPIASPV